jgi:ZIP family zinc transporter
MLLEAFGFGLIAQSSLFLAGLAVCWITVPTRVIGILAGFGAGALIAAIAFELVPEGQTNISGAEFALWTLIGVTIFLVGDAIVEKRFGSEGAGASMGIVVGSVVDGVPESIIFGIQIGAGLTVSPSFIAAVFVSNIPQAIAPSADLWAAGWNAAKLAQLWGVVVLACGLAAAFGFLITQVAVDAMGDRGSRHRRRRPARDAHQFLDAVRVPARRCARWGGHGRRVPAAGAEQPACLTAEDWWAKSVLSGHY